MDGILFENQTFNYILNEIKPTIILYDHHWSSWNIPYAAELNATFIAGMKNFIKNNCTL